MADASGLLFPKKAAPKPYKLVKAEPGMSPIKSPLRVKDKNIRREAEHVDAGEPLFAKKERKEDALDEHEDDAESIDDNASEKAQHGHENPKKRQRISADSPKSSPTKSTGRKKQRVTTGEEEEDKDARTPKKRGRAGQAPQSANSTERLFMATSEAEQYSSLDEDDDEAEKSAKAKGSKGKDSAGGTKGKRNSTGKAEESSKSSTAGRKKGSRKSGGASSGDARKDEVVRLKSYVVACGVRKQWAKFFDSKGCAGETPEMYVRQRKVLQEMLSELGMVSTESPPHRCNPY